MRRAWAVLLFASACAKGGSPSSSDRGVSPGGGAADAATDLDDLDRDGQAATPGPPPDDSGGPSEDATHPSAVPGDPNPAVNAIDRHGIVDQGIRSPDLMSAYCAAAPPALEGHFSGVATIRVFWTDWDELGPPWNCATHDTTTTAAAELDLIAEAPYQMSVRFPGHTPLPHEFTLGTPQSPWLVDPSGTSLSSQSPCPGQLYENYAPGKLTIDPTTGAATVDITCSISFLDPCTFPINAETDYRMTLAIRCVPNETVCIGGAAITCDATGNITSSMPCGAPCGPCKTPMSDACGPSTAPVCVNTEIDRDNCGGCGHSCATDEFCAGAVCVPTCTMGQSACPPRYATYCADLDHDANNCGLCGGQCPLVQHCSGGVCLCPAATPHACGSGAAIFCTNTNTDNANCGACGHACSANALCANGVCSNTCPSGQNACRGPAGNSCADISSDHENCGACFHACSATEICGASTCVPCAMGLVACNDLCVDPELDMGNCGACGIRCGTGACFLGQCVQAAPAIRLVNVNGMGQQGGRNVVATSVTSGGRFVTFSSNDDNLLPGNPTYADILVRDTQTGINERADVANDGSQPDRLSQGGNISNDGRFIAFWSPATNLVPLTNIHINIFLRDRQLGVTSLVSLSSNGTQQDADSQDDNPSLSDDGRFVAFGSQATNLVPSDTHGVPDVFIRDTALGQTIRVSVSSTGVEGNGGSWTPSWTNWMSADGRFVAFFSAATNLVPGDTNGVRDAFVHDMLTGQTTRVNVATDGTQANAGQGFGSGLTMSRSGRFVAFTSSASTLAPGGSDGLFHLFIHDMQTSETTRVDNTPTGALPNGGAANPAVSDDGRFVAFNSAATNLVPSPGPGDYVVVHDRTTHTTMRAGLGIAAAISPDGAFILFWSTAGDLGANTAINTPNAFVVANPLAP
jgi:hypothetical protein